VTEPVVSFRSVVAMVDRFPALAGMDLTIERGESVLVTGSNGAGKTSLVRAIAGLLPIAQGEAIVLGSDLTRFRRAVRRQIGFLGHSTSLYDELTTAENVTFAVAAAGGDVGGVGPALDQLALGGRLAQLTLDRLSAGQRRRAALAVVVARDPALWLLDEPHAGLDAQSRDTLDAIVKDAIRRGRTVVITSHEWERGRRLTGREVIVSGGVIAGSSSSHAAAEADSVVNVPGESTPVHVA